MDFHEDRGFYVINSQREEVRFENISEEEVERINAYDYAVVYYVDKVDILDLSTPLLVFPLTELIELRAFNEEGEYFITKYEDGFVGRVITDVKVEEGKDQKEEKDKKDEESGKREKFEIVDEYHKLWGRVNDSDRSLLTEDRGISLKLPFELEAGKNIAFVKVRNYFTATGDLQNVDYRLCGFETGLESGKEGED